MSEQTATRTDERAWEPGTTMRAWRVTSHGEPVDVLHLDEIAVPQPGPGEILVRVRTVALNFPDVLLSRGEYQVRPELPFVPGIELCGEVVALGDGVERVAVGQRVVGSHIGVLSQYAVLPAGSVHAAPDALDDARAAGLTIAYQTAWFALHRRAGLQPGERVLVHAAAGGVGTAAVQLAVAAGAQVIGVVGSPEKAAVARDAGAHHVIVRARDAEDGTNEDDLVAQVKELTGGKGADVVVDPVGGTAFEQSVRCIAFEGRLVVIGFASGRMPQVRANHALVKNYSVLGLHWALYTQHRPDLVDHAHAELTRLADSGEVNPVVDAVVPFDEAPAAVQRLADGSTTGRVVVRVDS